MAQVILLVLFAVFLYFFAMAFKHYAALGYAFEKKGLWGMIQMFLAVIIHEIAAIILP